MLDEMQIEFVRQSVGEKIERCHLLKETSCSWLWLVGGEHEYVLKIGKRSDISEEYENHRTIYDIWLRNERSLDFKIPRPYAIGSDSKSYVMDYIKKGQNLLEILLRKAPQTDGLFRRTGQCLRQYHELTTNELVGEQRDFFSHNTVEQILMGPNGKKLKRLFCEFEAETKKIIFKDFKPTNAVVDEDNKMYFLDFQKIYYFAPFYYDLARFIDTTKVFSLVGNPLFFLFNNKRITSSLRNFLEGYDGGVDLSDLRKMQGFHRIEHIKMKANTAAYSSLLLWFIYRLV